MLNESFMFYINNYGYISLLILLALGFIGIPLPEHTLLTFTGFLVSEGGLNYLLTILSTSLGTIIGMTASFSISHYLGIPFIEKYGHLFGLSKDKFTKLEVWFDKYGKFTLTFGYFLPGLRHFTAYFAGISKLSFKSLFIFAYPGAFIWTTVVITSGYILGESWEQFLVKFEANTWIIFVLVLIILVLYLLYRRYIKVLLK